jgi:hypothetical protein
VPYLYYEIDFNIPSGKLNVGTYMKNQLRILALATFAIVLATGAFAKPNYVPFSIMSQSSHNLGTVQILQDGYPPVFQYVPNAGTYIANMNSRATVVIINNYVIQPGTVGYAVLSDGSSVRIDFSGGNNIVVTDQQIVN